MVVVLRRRTEEVGLRKGFFAAMFLVVVVVLLRRMVFVAFPNGTGLRSDEGLIREVPEERVYCRREGCESPLF